MSSIPEAEVFSPMFTSRARRPRLFPQGCLLDYDIRDVLDASTPEELHTASYGTWLGELFLTPAWGASASKTLVIAGRDALPLDQLLWPAPVPQRHSVIYARRLEEGRVISRSWAHLVGDLSQRTAIQLSMQAGILSPVLFAEGVGAWKGIGIPALEPIFNVDLLSPGAILRALKGYHMEYVVPEHLREAIQPYGWNPIAEFRRRFETVL